VCGRVGSCCGALSVEASAGWFVCRAVPLVCRVEDSGISGDCVPPRRLPIESEYLDRLHRRESEVRNEDILVVLDGSERPPRESAIDVGQGEQSRAWCLELCNRLMS
jgi:hypothetical protein